MNGEMHLSKVGEFADVQFQNVSSHYPYAEIPLWIIMPNHIHCIIVVDAKKTKYDRRVVETWRAASLQQNDTLGATPHVMSPREIANMQGWLSVAIGGLKSSITRFANENGIAFGWQTRFHDHIVRNVEELNAIAKYIENNVANWKEDEFNDAL